MKSIKIRIDNQSIIVLINNSNNYRRIKHIFIQYHYVKKLVKNQQMQFIYVSINNMLIDDLIKSLIRQSFETFIRMLKLISTSHECI